MSNSSRVTKSMRLNALPSMALTFFHVFGRAVGDGFADFGADFFKKLFAEHNPYPFIQNVYRNSSGYCIRKKAV